MGLARKGMDLGVRIIREMEPGPCPLTLVFQGFEKVTVVRSIFGDETESVLARIQLVPQSRQGYLHVDTETGSIVINTSYLNTGDERYLYLDLIHELVHVKQLIEGRELFDRRFSYVDRPTEIEAYSVTVQEAKRIGMNYEEILDYLKVEWVTEEEFVRLQKNVKFTKPRRS